MRHWVSCAVAFACIGACFVGSSRTAAISSSAKFRPGHGQRDAGTPPRQDAEIRKVATKIDSMVGPSSDSQSSAESEGSTLPSAYYLLDDVQYFPPGPEFVLGTQHAGIKK